MEDRARAHLHTLQANLLTAQKRLQELQTEQQQLMQFVQAAQGAVEVLQDLLQPAKEEGIVLG